MPVLVSISGYGQGLISPFSPSVKSAEYHGYAVIGIGSTGPFDGAGGFGLEFPANGIINPKNPTRKYNCNAKQKMDYFELDFQP